MVDATLRGALSDVPSKALDYSSRMVLCRHLDVKQLLASRSGHLRDYRGLAELMGFQYKDIKMFERHDEPTLKILEAWETRPDAQLRTLLEFLEEMDRYDVVEELVPFLKKLSEAFFAKQRALEIPVQVSEVTSGPLITHIQTDLLTCDDLRTGECTFYDAYVCYADEDSAFVQQLSAFLESPNVGLKLFVRGRDMLAGSPELDSNIELIKHRCKKMLIVLTENFIHSPQCAFQISFAATLSIEQQKRTLIPVLLFPMSSDRIPSVLSTVSKIDFTRPCVYSWMWQKLIMSLLPQDRQTAYWAPESLPPQPVDPDPVRSEPTDPVITFPETVQLKALPAESTVFSHRFLAETPVVVPQKSPSKSKKGRRFNFPFRRKQPASSSYSSGATSGYCSDST